MYLVHHTESMHHSLELNHLREKLRCSAAHVRRLVVIDVLRHLLNLQNVVLRHRRDDPVVVGVPRKVRNLPPHPTPPHVFVFRNSPSVRRAYRACCRGTDSQAQGGAAAMEARLMGTISLTRARSRPSRMRESEQFVGERVFLIPWRCGRRG